MPLAPSATVSVDLDTVTPAVSPSVTVTANETIITLSYSSALSAATTSWVMEAMSSTASSSAALTTHTRCTVLQLLGVKVSVFWLRGVLRSVSTVTSELPVEATRITTSELGWASSFTV